VFRDSRGVVHTVSSADPLADLPPGAARALQEALLPTGGVDLGTVLERGDALRELVESWQDAFFAALPDDVDLAEEARWAAEAGLSLEDVEAGYEDDDDGDEVDLSLLGLGDHDDDLDDLDDLDDDPADLDDMDDMEVLLDRGPDGEDDPRRVLPEELVHVLERELLLLPVRVRLEALVAAVDVVEQWTDTVADHEKLVGHLVLAHGQLPHPDALEHDVLSVRHAALHAEHGPAHQEAG
jgi:hypothetical protein